jgi:hypothetical protein
MNTTQAMAQDLASSRGERSQLPHFLVGRNSRGQWVVRDRQARRGGLFDNRADALRFAFRERGEAPGAVVLVPDVLELFEAPSNDATVPGQVEARAAAARILLEV